MKVRIGYEQQPYGEVESTANGLILSGGSVVDLRRTVEGVMGMQVSEVTTQADGDRALKSLRRSLNNGYWWCSALPDGADS